MYFLYSLITLIGMLLVSPYFIYQAVRYRKYVGSLRQRLGHLPVSFNLDGDESIWIHAVSVGEALTARPLLQELRQRYPHFRLFVSTTTIAGQQVARRLQDVDAIFYFPFDWTFAVRRTLNLVKPRLFVMMETEIWPNLLRECRRRGVRTALVNGRISSRSYPRYRLVRPFFRRVLADVDRFCVQGEESRRRLVDLGADPARIVVTGSLKFDSLETLTAATSHARARDRVLRFFHMAPGRTVIIAGSTLKGEEAAMLRAFGRVKTIAQDALLVLAPRHPERFGEVERLARDAGFRTERRSELPIDAEPRVDVVVLDTIGELARLYQIATIVFVGGSLVNAGGHNILEPAVFGRPILFGPHMDNFREIADDFLASGAARQVQSGRDLEDRLVALLTDPVRQASLGAAARALVEANRGARDKSLAVVTELLPPATAGADRVVRPFRLVQ